VAFALTFSLSDPLTLYGMQVCGRCMAGLRGEPVLTRKSQWKVLVFWVGLA
jgi:hypothetical protein